MSRNLGIVAFVALMLSSMTAFAEWKCRADWECKGDRICRGGRCVDADDDCSRDSDCRRGEICRRGNCVVADPCKDVDCGGNGKCKVQSDSAVCVCVKGYHAEGLNCVETKDPCEKVTCSGHGKCQDIKGVALCACEPGYKVKDRLFCQEVEVQPFQGGGF
jgi:hypothetical protein